MIDLKQKQLKEWQERNFPRSRYESMTKDQLIDLILPLQMALGMCEEVGEVAHAVLKGSQNIREGVKGIDKEAVFDGCGDVNIFATQLLSSLNMSVEQAYSITIHYILKRDWINNPENGDTEDANNSIPK